MAVYNKRQKFVLAERKFIKNKEKYLNNKKLVEITKKNVTGWLEQEYWAWNGFEMQYKGIEPKIIIDPLMRDEINTPPREIEVYCFNGVPKIYVNVRYTDKREITVYNEDFSISDLILHPDGKNLIINEKADDIIYQTFDLSIKLAHGEQKQSPNLCGGRSIAVNNAVVPRINDKKICNVCDDNNSTPLPSPLPSGEGETDKKSNRTKSETGEINENNLLNPLGDEAVVGRNSFPSTSGRGDRGEGITLAKESHPKAFPFVRIDWLVYKNKLYFNELTFTPYSGFIEFDKKWNLKLGSWIVLEGGRHEF